MIDFDNNETYDLFMAAFDKAMQLSTFENRNRVRQMFRDQMRRTAAAEARVTELEARLAEQAWRLVTEPPTTEEMYLTWDGYEIKALGYYTYWEDDSLTWRDEFDEPVADITHWRPLPPPPAATE